MSPFVLPSGRSVGGGAWAAALLAAVTRLSLGTNLLGKTESHFAFAP
jgi:hypothetical protein